MANPMGDSRRLDLGGVERRAQHRVEAGGADVHAGPVRSHLGRPSRRSCPRARAAGTVMATISANRATDRAMPSMSTPRSNRADASLRRPRRFDVRAMAIGHEVRGLEHHPRRPVVDLGGRAAHDAGDADRPVRAVGDHTVRVGPCAEHPLDVVERDERLARAGGADAEDRPRQAVEVVGVGRLTELEHHVVRRVDHVGDRPHTGQREAADDAAAVTERRAGRRSRWQ